MSDSDVEKGSRWETAISQELEGAQVGIICLTPDNIKAPWILFESGALSKKSKRNDARVCTYLHRLTYSDIEPPLSMFQHTLATKEDTRRLIHEIRRVSKSAVSEDGLNKLFDLMWPDLEQKLNDAPQLTARPHRDSKEMLEELVELARQIAKTQQTQIQSDIFGNLLQSGPIVLDSSGMISALYPDIAGRPELLQEAAKRGIAALAEEQQRARRATKLPPPPDPAAALPNKPPKQTE